MEEYLQKPDAFSDAPIGDDDDTALLKAFARKRGLDTSGPRWEQKALILAGLEDKELQPRRRPGRPLKKRGLHEVRLPNEAEKLAILIEDEVASAKREKREPRRAVEFVRECVAVTTARESHHFKSRTRALEIEVSKARKALRETRLLWNSLLEMNE